MPANRYGILIGILFLIGILGYVWFGVPRPEWAKWHGGISEVWIGTPPSKPRSALNILFVGNSYTYCQDMPKMLMEIAAHDVHGNAELRVQSVTQGGGDLQGLWKAGQAAQIIQGAHWTYVVLQEESFWAMSEGGVERSTDYFGRFDTLVRKAGAHSVLYLTWARGTGGDWYTSSQYSFLRSPQYMQSMFTYQTHNLAAKLNVPVADVGEYWKLALEKDPNLPLYGPDHHHPGPAGGYLTALVFYSLFTGRDSRQVTWAPSDVPDPIAAEIREIAAMKLHQAASRSIGRNHYAG